MKDFSRIEELVGIIKVADKNHVIDPDKIELVRDTVEEGQKLERELSLQANDGVFDAREAASFLLEARVIFADAKGDLELPWNDPKLIAVEETENDT